MNCKTCSFWNKERHICEAYPDELINNVCLQRNILWALLMLLDDEEKDEGESWKNN